MKKSTLATLSMLAMAAAVAASGPVPVSPGGAAAFAGAGSACPTFSWSGTEGSAGYEMVAYAVAAEAWAVSSSNGTMFLNGPAFFDSIDFFPDGSTLISELEVNLDLLVGGEVEISDLTVPGLADTLCADAAGGSLIGRCTSSARYKDEVGDLSLGLETVLELHPVTFRWKGDGVEDLGFIAEEVAAVDPILATYDDQGLESGVKYRRMTALLARAIQQLAHRLDEQSREIDRLEKLTR